MNSLLLNTDSQAFITKNLNSDIASMILKGIAIDGLETVELIEQIESKKRCIKKLPTWFHNENIYYPNKLNIEQTSSEITAEFKAALLTGSTLIDLTGGFGVDCFYFSKRFDTVSHCEINDELSNIVSHNYKQLKVENVETVASDGLEFLKNSAKFYDWIYVDPSRRHDVKGKVFFLKDCLPNVPNELELLFEHSKNIMIKTSPLLDISAGIEELKHVKSVYVLAVDNDVKELLWILEKEYHYAIAIEAVNLKSDTNEIFKFKYSHESISDANYSLPLTYLYEPNSAVLKAGAFNSVASQLELLKLHKHSHLYTSEQLIDFPGRSFEINKVLPYGKKTIKNLNIQKANITTRNFPETVEQIRKKYGIKDGGDIYLFFTTNFKDAKFVLVCSKINQTSLEALHQ